MLAIQSIKAQNINFDVDLQKKENNNYEVTININNGEPNFTILIYENPMIADPVLKVTNHKLTKFTCPIQKPGSYYIEIRDSNLDIKGKSIRIQ